MLRRRLQDARDARRRRGLAEHPLGGGEPALRLEYLRVADGGDRAAGLLQRDLGLLPAGRVADPDRGRDRLGLLDRVAEHDRRRALGLEPVEVRPALPVLDEALPPGGHVARVADRDRERVGRRAQLVAHLERRGLLALDAVRVDRVHQLDRLALDDLLHELQRLVEVAAQRDHARAVHHRLGELAARDLALRDDHRAAHARARGVGGRARGRVARRGADDRLRPLALRPRDRERHAAVLEAAGRVHPLELEVRLDADALRQARRVDQRRRALHQRHDRESSASSGSRSR